MARYVFSDLHAQTNLGIQILNYLQPDDTLYFLGDSVDRGPGGLTLLNLLLSDPQSYLS